MTQNRTRKTTAKKTTPRKGRPTPARPEPQRVETTADDYKVDPAILMEMLGVDPRSVQPDSVRLTFTSGVAVLEYGIRRAVPPKILGVAMLRAANSDVSRETSGQGEEGEPSD